MQNPELLDKNLVLSYFITGKSNECVRYYSLYFGIYKMITVIKGNKDIENY